MIPPAHFWKRLLCTAALAALLLPGQEPPAGSLLERATRQRQAGDYTGELATLRAALQAADNAHGPDSLDAANVLLRLADVQMLLGGFSEGFDLATRALRIYEAGPPAL